ncbi:MAG: DUF3786 domain-containing protein [Desulfobacula sp.]|nr:DUF3786 domain-containing protein [Desulfobacula sp.]
MSQFANAMEVFKLLEKSNCRKCNETTCLAFASKVFLGQKTLDMCPALDPEVIQKYGKRQNRAAPGEADQEKALLVLKNQLKDCDFSLAAQRTGGKYANGRLTLKIFGKPFSLDNAGRFQSDLHINPWIVMPVLGYVLHCQGRDLTGKWVPFRELKNGREKNGLFVHRSEEALKKIADTYPDLFEDLILIFSGKKVDNHYESDISLVLYPLPRVPFLICYWKPEEGMSSELHLFFDSSADMNGGIDVIFGLSSGIVQMFEKMALTHGIR